MTDQKVFDVALKGHFYAVGVGPGTPDLLTYRAARIVETADVVIAPRSARAKQSLAFETVRHLITARQEIVDHQYSMIKGEAAAVANWMPVSDLVAERCGRGQSVAQITLGDPMIYSTTAYLLPQVLERIPEGRAHVVPGISAFQAAASLFNEPLTIQQDRMMLMPATDLGAVEQALKNCETLILYKCAKVLDALIDLLERSGLIGSARLVCYVEQDDRQVVLSDLREARLGEYGYMATVIVYIGRKE